MKKNPLFITSIWVLGGSISGTLHAQEICQSPQFENVIAEEAWSLYSAAFIDDDKYQICFNETETVKATQKKHQKYEMIIPKGTLVNFKGLDVKLINQADVVLNLKEEKSSLQVKIQQDKGVFDLETKGYLGTATFDYELLAEYNTEKSFLNHLRWQSQKTQLKIKALSESQKPLPVKLNNIRYAYEASIQDDNIISSDQSFSVDMLEGKVRDGKDTISFQLGKTNLSKQLENINKDSLEKLRLCTSQLLFTENKEALLTRLSKVASCSASELEKQEEQGVTYVDWKLQDLVVDTKKPDDLIKEHSAQLGSFEGRIHGQAPRPFSYQANTTLRNFIYEDSLDNNVSLKEVSYNSDANSLPLGSLKELLQCGQDIQSPSPWVKLTSVACFIHEGKRQWKDMQGSQDFKFKQLAVEAPLLFGNVQVGDLETALRLENGDLSYDFISEGIHYDPEAFQLPQMAHIVEAKYHFRSSIDDSTEGKQPMESDLDIILADDAKVQIDAETMQSHLFSLPLPELIESLKTTSAEVDIILVKQDTLFDIIEFFIPQSAYVQLLLKLYGEPLKGDQTRYHITLEGGQIEINNKPVPFLSF